MTKIEELGLVHTGLLNTPLEFMPALTKRLGKGNLYIKRDDLTGLAFGGNKTRKLDYIVKYALDNHYTALLTFGGVQTNHGRLTAAAAIRYGLKPILVLKGKKPARMSGNVLLDRLMGVDLYYCDLSAADKLPESKQKAAKDAFLNKAAERITREYAKRGEKVLVVPTGGSTVLGACGYVQAVAEIMRQMKEQQIEAKHLVVGYGSTGTFSGLWAGARYYHAPFEVIGIPIRPDYHPLEECVTLINQLSQRFNMGFTAARSDIHLETGEEDCCYGGTGYNEPDPLTQQYIKMLAETEAIFTDPCYTGKVLHGFIDLVEKGKIAQDGGAIFLHTGGLPGLWTEEHLASMNKTYWSDSRKDSVHEWVME
jgi:D-cysteine desulfhydrase